MRAYSDWLIKYKNKDKRLIVEKIFKYLTFKLKEYYLYENLSKKKIKNERKYNLLNLKNKFSFFCFIYFLICQISHNIFI